MIRAQGTDNHVCIDRPKTHHLMATNIRHENFPRRWHDGDTPWVLQRARGSRQLPHPRAIRGPQHHDPMVEGIHHEEEVFVGGERQTARVFKLTGFIAM